MKREAPSGVLESRALVYGVVESVRSDHLLVGLDGETVIVREALRRFGEVEKPLGVGDRVLVAVPGGDLEHACVVGVVESIVQAGAAAGEGTERRLTGRRIVVEAGERLELRVGDNQIVITEDGRILIQGQNLLSRARALNRIKGGAVQIN